MQVLFSLVSVSSFIWLLESFLYIFIPWEKEERDEKKW